MGIVDELMVTPCTITPRTQTGTVDRYNNPAWVDGSPVASTCYKEQIQAEEITVGQETQIATERLFLPAGDVLAGSYRVTVDGVIYEVVGPPWYVDDPFVNAVDHIEAKIRVVTG